MCWQQGCYGGDRFTSKDLGAVSDTYLAPALAGQGKTVSDLSLLANATARRTSVRPQPIAQGACWPTAVALPTRAYRVLLVQGGGLRDSFLVDGVAFKKTFSYAGFEMQPKQYEASFVDRGSQGTPSCGADSIPGPATCAHQAFPSLVPPHCTVHAPQIGRAHV